MSVSLATIYKIRLTSGAADYACLEHLATAFDDRALDDPVTEVLPAPAETCGWC